MKEESLIVKVKKTGKYNSYAGEITPPVDNVINRNFKALHPNEKWLTDITEFAIPAGKVYLSPIVHSDRGVHYRWPGWISRMNSYGLTRSMSKKGCSPDNSACEGVFGRIKKSLGYLSPMEYRRNLGLVA